MPKEIKIVPYDVHHFFLLPYANLHEQYGLSGPEDIAVLFLKGPGFTMFVDGEIVGAAGIINLWTGVGDAWFLTSKRIHEYPILVHKTIKKYLQMLISAGNLIRVQAIVAVGFEMGHKWIKSLGFEQEGPPMRKYFNNRDFVRYVIIKGDQ